MLTRFFRYSFVGFLGIFVNLFVFAVCVRAGLHYMIAAILAFLFAASHNFLWHYFWTFSGKVMERKAGLDRYIRFVCISSLCLAINLVFLYFFVEILLLAQWQAQIIAVIIMGVLSFVMQNTITFADAKKDELILENDTSGNANLQ